MLEKKYKIKLSKERYERANERQQMILETLTSQLQRLIDVGHVGNID